MTVADRGVGADTKSDSHDVAKASAKDPRAALAERYEFFAEWEARGRSALYEDFAREIAADTELLDRLTTLPSIKRQPNLLLAAVRFLLGTPDNYADFRRVTLAHWGDVVAEMLVRRTQTNEVARCATLLPVLAALPQPLALLEVGPSAGLCLLLDRFHYDYGDHQIGPIDSPVRLRCATSGPVPIPTVVPTVSWRRGLDIAPVDVADPEAVRWLEALVWPGEEDRLERLQAAVSVARVEPPQLLRGDLTSDVSRALSEAPTNATVVVFHSAVLAYLDRPQRAAFAADMADRAVVWVSNEGARVFPDLATHISAAEKKAHRGDFLLCRDGTPVAWTDHHGAAVHWRPQPV